MQPVTGTKNLITNEGPGARYISVEFVGNDVIFMLESTIESTPDMTCTEKN